MSYYTVPITPRFRLWEHEIKNIIIYPHLKRIISIASNLDSENDWLSMEQDKKNEIDFGNEFFTKFALVKSTDFLEIATTIISDFPWSDFLMNKIPLKKHINFTKIISSSKHPLIDYILINILPTEKFIGKLVEKNAAFIEICCKINSIIKHDRDNYVYANCVLIRNLPFISIGSGNYDEWLKYFLRTLDEFPETRPFLKCLDIDLKNYFNYSQTQIDDDEVEVGAMNFEDKLIVTPKHPGKFRLQNNFNPDKLNNQQLLNHFKGELRNYQKECITSSLLGESGIIILPTKTGKKICTNEIIRNHISVSREKNKPYRVCLVVSSLQSLSEISLSLKQYFQQSISIFSGCLDDFPNHTVDKLLANDVVVVTPTFLYCCLNSLLMEQKIFYNDFTLLIIEDIQNQANKITSKYLIDDLFMERVNINQIIGIFVNISINYSYYIDDVLYSFFEMCAKTKLSRISIPKIYHNEMTSYFQNCYDILLPFDLPDSYFKGLMEMKVSRLLIKLQFLKDNGYTFNENDDSLLPNISTYEFMLALIKVDFELQLSNQDYKIQEMIVVINCLKEYFHATLISSILPIIYATDFLKERYKVLEKHIGHFNSFKENFSDFDVIIKEVDESYSRKDIQSPSLLLEKVTDVIKKEILTSHHIVIFAPTNYMVKSLEKYFHEIFLYNNVYAIGLSNIEANDEKLRKNVYSEFKKGTMSILITTYVVDWKYPLPDRNLDININDCLYDMNSCLSAPTIMKRENKRYLFYYPSYIPSSCETNIQRQKTLRQFCERISKFSKKDINTKIDNLVKKLKYEESYLENFHKQRETVLKENIYKLRCKTCAKYLGSSKSVKKYMDYYIIMDGNFFKRVHIKLHNNSVNGFEIFSIGQIICSKCSNEKSEFYLKNSIIGNLISHGSTYFCSLKSTNLVWEDDKGNRFNKNNWYDIEKRLVFLEEIKEIEWLSYNNEFAKTNPDLVEDLKTIVGNDKNRKTVKSISKIVHFSECLEIFR
uniref:RLR CTR domain-containing protein n=1 Tax=Strongyloides venezuelensis TaxID=75913 RepID=A0A0K0F9L9_STRVS